MKSNFFKELEFYKKDSVPDAIFKSLEKFITDPKVKWVLFLLLRNDSKGGLYVCPMHGAHYYALKLMPWSNFRHLLMK